MYVWFSLSWSSSWVGVLFLVHRLSGSSSVSFIVSGSSVWFPVSGSPSVLHLSGSPVSFSVFLVHLSVSPSLVLSVLLFVRFGLSCVSFTVSLVHLVWFIVSRIHPIDCSLSLRFMLRLLCLRLTHSHLCTPYHMTNKKENRKWVDCTVHAKRDMHTDLIFDALCLNVKFRKLVKPLVDSCVHLKPGCCEGGVHHHHTPHSGCRRPANSCHRRSVTRHALGRDANIFED